MSSDSEKGNSGKGTQDLAQLTTSNSIRPGETDVIDDAAVREFYSSAVNDSYRLKSELVSQHLGEIGMGKFQWILFVVNGFGWVVDNFWSQGITAVRPPVGNEFSDVSRLSYSSVAYYIGLIIGATFWGTTADLIGRKSAFNATILIGGVFACAVAAPKTLSPSVPSGPSLSHQWLLVSLSAWWNLGQVIVALLSWVFLANFACYAEDVPCPASDNMGWRYLMITLGAIAIAFGLFRILLFKIPESPRYLICEGRDDEAVEAVKYIARYNGREETLTLDMLQATDRHCSGANGSIEKPGSEAIAAPSQAGMSYMQILKESFKDYNTSNYSKLFAGRKMAQHTSVTFLIWLTIGIAYPLYFAFITSYLQTKKTYSANTDFDHSYMVYCIVSAVGALGPVAAGFSVETRFGRRWMMAISAALTGVFLFVYTIAATEAADIGFQCATGILGNFEYAVMYAFTPESFPGPVRGTGTGIAATLLRLGGLVASLISTFVGYTVVPIYASAALWILAGIFCFGLPFETHGHASI
ncbi:hypothetical protein QQZ08_008357 [Neonectria magnoliae]|uniref:Major facilitator superfamily (MFS) profile domain-containing protein n=1 Tax=Neonectria magnoliae TaxID=2732573 RepID=A0ABR1HV20_9HYPO